MNHIARLKIADAQGDLTEVMGVVCDLLENDFTAYVAKVTGGFEKFLIGGVFSPKYRDAFWRSDLPDRFGSKWSGHKLFGYAFWQALIIEPTKHIDLLSRLARECPNHVITGLRRQRIFLDKERWFLIKSVLVETGLGKFIEKCEALLSAKDLSEKRLQAFTPLLKKISAESLVLHFAIWVEKVYFDTKDDRDFRIRMPEKVEVLEHALTLRAKFTAPCSAIPKTIDELKKLMVDTFGRIRKNPRQYFDADSLFESLDHHLAVDYMFELFCSMDWEINNDYKGVSAHPANEEQEAAWFLHLAKFHVMDCFEIWCPILPEEYKCMISYSENAPNQESANAHWHRYTAMRFLEKNCGAEVIESAEQKLGFSMEDALTVLLYQSACYEMTFHAPRAESKANHGNYLDSIGVSGNPSVLLDTLLGKNTLLSRAPFEPRNPAEFLEMCANCPATAHITSDRVRGIYDLVSHDIHASPIKLTGKILLKNQHCDLLLPRIFVGDIKMILFNHLFSQKPFTGHIARMLEQRIETIFGWRNFKTLKSRKLDKEGEVDVLAYREGTLFVIEAKCTRFRTKASEVPHVRDTLHEGALQLHRLRSILPKFWHELHSELHAPADFGEIQIIPLLVSNSLEFDHLYFDGILKISDFELEMVFANRSAANVTLNGYHEIQFAASDGMEGALKMQQRFRSLTAGDIEKFALYPPEPEPSVEELIACVEESRFWAKVFGRSVELTPLGVF